MQDLQVFLGRLVMFTSRAVVFSDANELCVPKDLYYKVEGLI